MSEVDHTHRLPHNDAQESDDDFEEPPSPPRRRSRRQPMSYTDRRPSIEPSRPAATLPVTTLLSAATRNNDPNSSNLSIKLMPKSSGSSSFEGIVGLSSKTSKNIRATSLTWQRRALSPIGSPSYADHLHDHPRADRFEGSNDSDLGDSGLFGCNAPDGDRTTAQRHIGNASRASKGPRSRIAATGGAIIGRAAEPSSNSALTPPASPRRLRPLRSTRNSLTVRAPMFATGSVRFQTGAPYPTRPRPRMLELGVSTLDAGTSASRATPETSNSRRICPPDRPLWKIESTAFHSAHPSSMCASPSQRLHRMDPTTRRAQTRAVLENINTDEESSPVSHITGKTCEPPYQGKCARLTKRRKMSTNSTRFLPLELEGADIESYIDGRPLPDSAAEDERCLGPLPPPAPGQPTRARKNAQRFPKARQGRAKRPAEEKNRALIRGRLVRHDSALENNAHIFSGFGASSCADGNTVQQAGTSRTLVRQSSFRFLTEGRKKRHAWGAETHTLLGSQYSNPSDNAQLDFPSSRLGQGGSPRRRADSESGGASGGSSSGLDQQPLALSEAEQSSRHQFEERPREAENRASSCSLTRTSWQPRSGRTPDCGSSSVLVRTPRPEVSWPTPTSSIEAKPPQYYCLAGTNLTVRTPTPFRSPMASPLKDSTNGHHSSSMPLSRESEIALLPSSDPIGQGLNGLQRGGESIFDEAVLDEWLEPVDEMEPPSDLLQLEVHSNTVTSDQARI